MLLEDPLVTEVHLHDNAGEGSPALARAMSAPLAASLVAAALTSGRLHNRLYQGPIYAAWNYSIIEANRVGCPVAVLNDDIVLAPGSLHAAANAAGDGWALVGLNYKPPHRVNVSAEVTPVVGTFRTGGFGGFAFVLAPDAPLINPGFQWWYGDDDLAERLKAQGKRLGVHTGAPVEHPEPSLTGNTVDWVCDAATADGALFRRLWPNAP